MIPLLCLCLLNFDLPIDASMDQDWLVVYAFLATCHSTVLGSMMYYVLGTDGLGERVSLTGFRALIIPSCLLWRVSTDNIRIVDLLLVELRESN